MTRDQRSDLMQRLGDVICAALASSPEMIEDAVFFGRVGLESMTDEELLDSADTWGVDHD